MLRSIRIHLIKCGVGLCLLFAGLAQGQSVDELSRKGWTAFESGDFAGAIRFANQAIGQHPNNPEHYYCRGAARLQDEQFKLAEGDFSRAVELGGGNLGNYHFGRGNARLYLQNFPGAVTDFEAALELMEPNPDLYTSLALAERGRNHYEEAIGYLDAGLLKFPSHPEMTHSRAVLYLETGKQEQALKDLNTFLSLGRPTAMALLDRALLLYEMEEESKALTDLDRAAELDPELADIYFFQGQILRSLNRNNAARLAYDQFLSRAPAHVEGLLGRAYVCMQMEDFPAAIVDAEGVLSQGPHPAAFSLRGVARASQQQFDLAIRDLDQAIALDADEPRHFLTRGHIRLLKGDAKGAVRDISDAIRINPNDPEMYYRRAEAYRSQGQEELAVEDLDSAHQLEKKMVD